MNRSVAERMDAPAGQGAPLVALEGVAITLGGRRIVSDIEFALAPGEIVTMIGPNGAGKTSLARAVLGLLPVAQGRIHRRRGLRAGYVPQRFALDPALPLTVRRLLSLTGRVSRAATDQALAEVGVPHLAERQAHRLSGGELQRALLARALLRDPDLLVLDEPTQGVDVGGQIELFRLVRAIRDRRGCAVLMISHDLHVVMAATDRVLCINGHLCCEGAPSAVALHPEYRRLFGAPGAGELALFGHDLHHHEHDHAHEVGVPEAGAHEASPQETAPSRAAAGGS